MASLASAPAAPSPLASSRQLLLVIAPAWASSAASLRRFWRDSPESAWEGVGGHIPVSLGRSGLAWGIGLHGENGPAGPVKAEGDGRAPAGAFAVTGLFGYGDGESPLARAARLPYLGATPDLKAVDDPASIHYNRIVDQRRVTVDWRSHEEMRRSDERYAVGAVIAHNSPQPLPGAGSCIFLHVWQGPGIPTAGCTAGAFADIEAICLWLDGAASPVLVQLPQAEYVRCRQDWGLPAGAG